MFLENYYYDIMDMDVKDFKNCHNKIDLYNTRVRDVKENLSRVNAFIAHHEGEKKKQNGLLERWNKKAEQYLEIADKAVQENNFHEETVAIEEYSRICSRKIYIEMENEYHDSELALLHRAHEKLIKDVIALKEMENSIRNECEGEPKTVIAQKEEKKEPIFSAYTNVVIK